MRGFGVFHTRGSQPGIGVSTRRDAGEDDRSGDEGWMEKNVNDAKSRERPID